VGRVYTLQYIGRRGRHHCHPPAGKTTRGPRVAELGIAVARKEKDKKKKKKDAQLVLRLDSEMRDRFLEACRDLDTSAAREVRRFIKRFLKRYDNGELDDL
jgi:hypothetical protein